MRYELLVRNAQTFERPLESSLTKTSEFIITLTLRYMARAIVAVNGGERLGVVPSIVPVPRRTRHTTGRSHEYLHLTQR